MPPFPWIAINFYNTLSDFICAKLIIIWFLIFSIAARSPLYSHISSTIQGLSTIRAYKEEEKFLNNLHYYLNEHTKGWYLYIATNQWFGMRVDLINASFLAFAALSAVPLADSKQPYFTLHASIMLCFYSYKFS